MEILAGLSVDEATQTWLIYALLPTMYWHPPLHKTQKPQATGKIPPGLAASRAEFTDRATLPESELQRWLGEVDGEELSSQLFRSRESQWLSVADGSQCSRLK